MRAGPSVGGQSGPERTVPGTCRNRDCITTRGPGSPRADQEGFASSTRSAWGCELSGVPPQVYTVATLTERCFKH